MILSRFWYFLLAAAAATTLGAALLAQATFNRQYDDHLGDQLRRDRTELELWLRLDARARLDAIAPMAAHGDVREALRQASGRSGDVDPAVRKKLEQKLRDLNRQLEEMRADVIFALDKEGAIVAQLGAADPPAGSGLGAMPLVRAALGGLIRDDVWIVNGSVLRMAARPVIDGGQYVGALVHGKNLDQELAQKLGERLPGATVAFFSSERVIAAHVPAVEKAAGSEQLESKLKSVLNEEAVRKGGRSDPLRLEETAVAVYSLVTGSAAHAGVGYAIARPRQLLASPWQIFERASSDDVSSLPWALLGGGGLLLFLAGMLWLWLEHDRPFGRLIQASNALAKREAERFTVTDFGGGYRRLAEAVNDAMDKAVEKAAASAPKRKPADLDEILGPTPGKVGGSSYFGFANDESAEPPVPPARSSVSEAIPDAPPVSAPNPEPAAPKPPPGIPAAAPKAPPAPATIGNGSAPKPPVPRPAGGIPAPAAPAKPVAAPPAPPAPPKAPPAPAAATPVALSAPVAASSAGSDLWDEDEGATMVADIPRELIAASGAEAYDETKDFREVYEAYVATKRKCGESTAGLTFEKFSQTLRKNREQIVEKHGAKAVRFTVYEKEGKAALKATPVK